MDTENTEINTEEDILHRGDVAVIGAGHAGIEAALAAARLGCRTLLFTMSLDGLANMPCNPSIGGSAKGHLVYEIDALGGEMGAAADKVTMQSRTLNTGKGAAVRSKRVQADRLRYHSVMKRAVEKQENLRLIQAEIVAVGTETDAEGKKRVTSVTTRLGEIYTVSAVVIATGTYLASDIFVGDVVYAAGPDGSLPAEGLSDSLRQAGVPLRRFKTGTPQRVHRRSIDFSGLESQYGEDDPEPFSVRTDPEKYAAGACGECCHIVYTNARTHSIIRENLTRSAMYSGHIHGIGPRYCPSIEDKVVRFADKERHQLFIEPLGYDTDEMYIQGFSTSMPAEVQIKMLHSLGGFEHAEIMRYAYAIEYDCTDPTELFPTLEFKSIHGLYGAGQFNGTSGYEEAAAQGLVAGANAALALLGRAPLILDRAGSYIGTLIDDLITKGTNEPYRMMTSRSEYRLLLRQDNADLRLSEQAWQAGLISRERYNAYLCRKKTVEDEVNRAENTTVAPSERLSAVLAERGSTDVTTGIRLAELLRRPELDYKCLTPVDITRPALSRRDRETAEITIKYDGYIKRQSAEVRRMRRLEEHLLPPDIDYGAIKGLRIEASQKLSKIRPLSIGQASRISGVNPADISVLLIYLDLMK